MPWATRSARACRSAADPGTKLPISPLGPKSWSTLLKTIFPLSTQISIFTRTPVPTLFSSAMNLRVWYSTRVQQGHRPRTTATSHQQTGDLPQRPCAESSHRGGQGFNPLCRYRHAAGRRDRPIHHPGRLPEGPRQADVKEARGELFPTSVVELRLRGNPACCQEDSETNCKQDGSHYQQRMFVISTNSAHPTEA